MESVSVESLCNLLARSRLVPAEEVRAVRQRWLREAGPAAADGGKFCKWLVSNRYVTDYQGAMLLRGHADRFFLGDYKLLDRVGVGRMAGVYKAVHQLGQTVAIKVLPPSKARDLNTFARFQREARLALRLRHPNVVRTFQIAEADGLHYLVMEHLEGETLDAVLKRRGKLPPPEAVRIAYQALLGLQCLHEEGMVHRDVKPGNLMLVPGEGAGDSTLYAAVKLLDIGLGRALFDEADGTGGDNAELTAEGTILGTPDYMAPEQARDSHAADIRSDIYSLGCTLYHALAGQPPFPDTNLVRKMVRHATEPPPPLEKFNAEVPDGLLQIVGWMMAKDPAQRYPTPERAAQALQVLLTAGTETLPGPAATPQFRAFLDWLDSESGETLPWAAPAAAAPKPPPPLPAAPPKTVPAPSADVERVAAAATVEGPARHTPLALNRRDYLMLGIGAGGLLAAGGVGWLLSSLFKKKKANNGEQKSPASGGTP